MQYLLHTKIYNASKYDINYLSKKLIQFETDAVVKNAAKFW